MIAEFSKILAPNTLHTIIYGLSYSIGIYNISAWSCESIPVLDLMNNVHEKNNAHYEQRKSK